MLNTPKIFIFMLFLLGVLGSFGVCAQASAQQNAATNSVAISPPLPANSDTSAYTVNDTGTKDYYPADFERFAPQSALDMVGRIPGFSIRDLDSFKRGVSGATGNVLINGRVVTSKSGSIFSRLAELPIDRVEVIQISRANGGASGRVGELVANILLTSTGTLSGTADASLSGSTDGSGGISGALSTQYAPSDKVQLLWSLNHNRNRFRGETNIDTFDDFGQGRSQEITKGRSADTSTRAEASFEASPTIFLNGSALWSGSSSRSDTQIGSDFGTTIVRDDGTSNEWELNGSIAIGPTDAPKHTFTFVTKRSANEGGFESVNEDDIDQSRILSAFTQNELILFYRNTSSVFGKTLNTEFEWAQTKLSSTTDFQSGANAAPSLTSFEETMAAKESRFTGQLRGNIFSSKIGSIDIGIGAETSQISAAGTDNRSLTFITTYIGYQFQNSKYGEVSVSFERTVSQLNLSSFATNIDLVRGFVDNGNADLNPERQWVFTANYRKTFSDTGAVNISWTEEIVDGVIEFVDFGDGRAGFGNAGRGRRSALTASLVYPFSKGMLKGTTLNIDGSYNTSSFTDPMTGQKRPLSNIPRFSFGAGFDKQFEKLPINISAGISWTEGTVSQRLTDRQVFGSSVFVSANIQWTLSSNLQLSLSASASIPNSDRETFSQINDNGELFLSQQRDTRRPATISLSLSRTF